MGRKEQIMKYIRCDLILISKRHREILRKKYKSKYSHQWSLGSPFGCNKFLFPVEFSKASIGTYTSDSRNK